MKLGNKINLILFIFLLSINFSKGEDKISSSPLINIEKIKPSFEELDEDGDKNFTNQNLKQKKESSILKSSQAILIGLDKITAKSSKLVVKLNESKKFGPLEIKILKCGKVKINNIFLKLSIGFEKKPEQIEVSGRKILIPQVAAGIARIDFDDLCNKPLAASDYIEIALRYKGIIIDNIPILNDILRNETRRFIWLIDALYDKNCFLIANAEVKFKDLYQGNEWGFEFQRTISRITEMSQLQNKSL